MTPLVDVIFLLLLFFMLSSTFSTFGEITLDQATAAAGTPEAPLERFFVQLGPNSLTLNGSATTLGDLESALETGQVLVSLDTETSAQRLVDLLVRLRGRDGLSVTVLE